MSAYPRVEAYAIDYRLRVKAFHLGVCVKLVEVAYAQGKVRVGEQLYCLGFLQAHEQGVDILFYRAFLKQGGKCVRGFFQLRHVGYCLDGGVLLRKASVVHHLRHSDDYPARIKVVVQSLAFTQELGREQQVEPLHSLCSILHIKAAAVAYGYGALYHHNGVGIDIQDKIDHFFHMARVEIVFYRVVVGGSGNDNKVRIAVCFCSIQSSDQVQVFFSQILFDVVILNG